MAELCLDVGNSQIYGGLFIDGELMLKFRHETHRQSTSDQLGIFLRSVLATNNIDFKSINNIAISSVVPPVDYSLGSACIKYFDLEPFWIKPGIKTGLKIKTKHPNEVGSDLIASAIAATELKPMTNLIVIDLGTATTFVPITKNRELLGVVIQAGLKTSMHSLQSGTEQLPTVQILFPTSSVGRDTASAIQSGLFYGQIGAIKEIISRIRKEVFAGDDVIVIGTGGFSSMFEEEKLFTSIEPLLVLNGIRSALKLNLS